MRVRTHAKLGSTPARSQLHRIVRSLTSHLRFEAGNCADFFSIDLNTVNYAGALHDPVAATLFCAPQKARYTVINCQVVVEHGRVVTVDMEPVIEAHNRFARQVAGGGR